MKKYTVIIGIICLLSCVKYVNAQLMTEINASFYSQALDEVKDLKILLPADYFNYPANVHYPVIYYLHGWTQNQNEVSQMKTITSAYIQTGVIDPVIIVAADNDCSPFDGSFFMNSPLWGNYEDYNVEDVVAWMDENFRTIPERKGRAIMGNSMGGYGAFRYAVLHKDKFTAIAAHASIVSADKELFMDTCRSKIIAEQTQGPPYFYTYSISKPFTAGAFLMSGAFSPDSNSSQTYINPQVVYFLFDEYGNYIDSVYQKWQQNSITNMIKTLTPDDSTGILFACGINDEFMLYPSNLALADTLETLDLPFEFFSHTGGHSPTNEYKQISLKFLDSLLMDPVIALGIDEMSGMSRISHLTLFPNPVERMFTLSFQLKQTAAVKISLCNLYGSTLEWIMEEPLQAGHHQIEKNLSAYSPGVYFLRLQAGEEVVVQKVIRY